MRDIYYVVVRYLTDGNGAALGNKLISFDIKTNDDTEVITVDNRPYFVYLDNKVDVASGDLTYSIATGITTFTILILSLLMLDTTFKHMYQITVLHAGVALQR